MRLTRSIAGLVARSTDQIETLLQRSLSPRNGSSATRRAAQMFCTAKRALLATEEAEIHRDSGDCMAGTNRGRAEDSNESTEWVQAHEALSRLARERAAADAEEGRWLLAALRSAAHVHLGFGSDEGRASYQIGLSVCPECGKGHQQAGGELIAVGAEVVAMAKCDG